MNQIDAYIGSISTGLSKRAEGSWNSDITEPICYPEDAHQDYAAVELTSYWFMHRNRCIISMVQRFAPSGPILDIGGGNGAVSLALNSAGFLSIVLEPSSHGAAVAHSRGLSVIRSAFPSASIVDGSIPAVGLFDVLEHIDDDRRTLGDLRRVLKDGGWLYMTVPAFNWLWSDEDNAAGHARRYTIDSASSKLKKAGFDVAFATYMFSPLVAPILLLRSAPSLFGRVRGLKRPVASDHILPDNHLGRFISRSLTAEYRRIAEGKTVPVGSSVLIAARKV